MNFENKIANVFSNIPMVGAGCIVVKKEGDRFVKAAHYETGYANLETHQPISQDTVFRIASVSKMVVALAMMSLVEQNYTTIDTDISEILGYLVRNPQYPNIPITIKMLMTQTSSITDGYDDYETLEGYNGVNGHHFEVKLRDLLVPNTSKFYTKRTWDSHEPGSTFIYSNFGCGILACLIELLAKEPFTDYVKKTILDPLKIDASFQASTIQNQELMANLYYSDEQNNYRLARSKDDFIKSVYPQFSLGDNFRGPAGGMLISLNGLTKIIELFLNRGIVDGQRVIQQKTIDLMLTRHWQNESFYYYAKGLQIRFLPFENAILKGHTGSAYGLSSLLFFHEETNTGICFASNGGYFQEASQGLNQVQEQIIRIYYEEFINKR
ncbi:MAG: serine hydrolase domain-containing protein [Bacilli bacterium]